MSIEPFNRLVKLAARAFYDDFTNKGDNQPKTSRCDNRGIAVIVLDALTRRQWVREEDFAKDLQLNSKQLRRILRFFEEEKLVTRDHRRETAKGAKVYSAAVAATTDAQSAKEGEEKVKLHTHSYCCLDYAQIYDVVRYRLHRMKKKVKDELEDKNTVQEYVCPNCGKRYNALDALLLVSTEDDYFHCERCNGQLAADSDKLTVQEEGDGDDNARRRRREKLRQMLQGIEVQLKPLMDQLNRVKDLPVPEFGSLQAWETRARRMANGNANENDPSRNSQGYDGSPMPFLGETKVEVALSGIEGRGEDVKPETGSTGLKVLPPWMIKQGMNLTKEQLGEVKVESKLDGTGATLTSADDKKSIVENDDKKNLQDEYVKAYYAALLKRQQEQEEAPKKKQELLNASTSNNLPGTSSSRQIGMKAEREEDDEIYFEREESSVAGNATGNYKVNDLNIQVDADPDEEDDDDVDWEEG